MRGVQRAARGPGALGHRTTNAQLPPGVTKEADELENPGHEKPVPVSLAEQRASIFDEQQEV
jgi:hypothetical protein